MGSRVSEVASNETVYSENFAKIFLEEIMTFDKILLITNTTEIFGFGRLI